MIIIHDCKYCGYACKVQDGDSGAAVRCDRCGSVLWKHKQRSAQFSLAFALTGLLFFVPALFYPILTFEVVGRSNNNWLMTGVNSLASNGAEFIALIVLMTSICVPIARFAAVAAITLPIVAGTPHKSPRWLQSAVHKLSDWALLDVYLLAVAVTYAKLGNFGTMQFEPGWLPLLGIIASSIALSWSYEARTIALQTCQDQPRRAAKPAPRVASLALTESLLLTTAILIIPAYTTSILTIVEYGDVKHATVYGSVGELTEGGQYFLGGLMFVASIIVPITKLSCLSLLAFSVRIRMKKWRLQRFEIYKLIKNIGRWSFVDFFVVSLMVALANIGVFATATPEPGLLIFAGVVLATMIAAERFDSRLFWDEVAPSHDLLPDQYTKQSSK